MPKLSFSPSVYRMWLKRYKLGAILMMVPLALIVIAHGYYLPGELDYVYRFGSTLDGAALSEFISTTALSIPISMFVGAAAVVAGLLCFAYLQKGRAASMLHSLPPRREGLFFAAGGAGLTLLGLPVAASGLLFAFVQAINGVLAPGPVGLYILAMFSVAVFWFGITVFAGMFTGNTITQAVLTLYFALLPTLLDAVIGSYCGRFLFGYTGWNSFLSRLNPFEILTNYLYEVDSAYSRGDAPPVGTPFGFVLAGLVFLLLALLLYKRRALENAGEIIAMKVFRPVFRASFAVLLAIGVSALFMSMDGGEKSFGKEVALFALGAALGYAIAEMFVRRSLNILKYLKWAALCGVVLGAALVGLHFDVTGYGHMQLDAAEVEYVVVSGGYYDPGTGYYDNTVPGRVLEGNPVSWDDLRRYDLADEDGFLETLRQSGASAVLPKPIAEQVLRQDALAFTGQDAAAVVRLQNLLAQNANILRDSVVEYPYSSGSTNYTIPMTVRMKDGSLLRRNYSFSLQDGGEGFGIPEAWGSVQHMKELANGINFVHLGDKAWQIIMTGNALDYGAFKMTDKMWEGFSAAYLQDLAGRSGTESLMSQESGRMVDIEVELADGYAEEVRITQGYTNVADWLLENEYATERSLARIAG